MKKLLGIFVLVLLMSNNVEAASIAEELTQLNNLFKEGAITKEEFSKAKSILLKTETESEVKVEKKTKVKKEKMLRTCHILSIQSQLEGNDAGFRKLPGTELVNEHTGDVIYRPLQPNEIASYMTNLEQYINTDDTTDPLIKMAIIHYQFESIHPFYDGNGRTGRIINILYLIHQRLLDIPVLYLSRYIIKNKNTYYKTLQNARDKIDWESWNWQQIFTMIQDYGDVPLEDMRRTFNLGVGMILIIDKEHLQSLDRYLNSINEKYVVMGEVIKK